MSWERERERETTVALSMLLSLVDIVSFFAG